MKYALIGCGRIALNHIQAAKENGLEVVGLCDLVPENIDTMLQKAGMPTLQTHRYQDYRQMLAEQRPDLVAIATESGLHAGIALDCMEAGCNVIIEKPIALSMKDANLLVAKAQEMGVKACACHQNRFNESIQQIRKAVEEGRLGKLSHGTIHVRWNRNKGYYEQAPWRGTWDMDGGALMNQSIHGIDLLRWMMGDEVEEVFAFTSRRFHDYLEAEDIGVAVVRFRNGALGTIEGTTNVFPQNLEETLYLFGEQGTVKAGGKSVNTIDVWQFADARPEDAEIASGGLCEQVKNVYGNGRLYADMIAAIEQDRAPYVDLEAGRRALEMVLAIYQSELTGKPVKLPLQEFSVEEMKNHFEREGIMNAVY